MESMEFKEIESAVEAILFASGDPIQTERICVALDIDRPAAEQVLQKLMDHYAYDRRGVRLVRVEDTWQLCSAPDYADHKRNPCTEQHLYGCAFQDSGPPAPMHR